MGDCRSGSPSVAFVLGSFGPDKGWNYTNMLTGRFWPKTAVSALKQKHLTKKICRMQNQEMQNALESQPDRQTDRQSRFPERVASGVVHVIALSSKPHTEEQGPKRQIGIQYRIATSNRHSLLLYIEPHNHKASVCMFHLLDVVLPNLETVQSRSNGGPTPTD